MYVYIYIYIYIYMTMGCTIQPCTPAHRKVCLFEYHPQKDVNGVATISRLLTLVGLFCKRALQNRPIFSKETYNTSCTWHCKHHPQKDVNVLKLPIVACFCLSVPTESRFVWDLPTESCSYFKVTHRICLKLQSYPQKDVNVLMLPTEFFFFSNYPQKTVIVWVHPQKRVSLKKYPQKTEKGLGLPIYEVKPIYIYMCIFMYMYVYIYTYIYKYVYTYLHIYTCIYIHMYTYIYLYIYICIHIYIYTYIHIYTYVQPIANRVAQNLENISQNLQFSTRHTRIIIIYHSYNIITKF